MSQLQRERVIYIITPKEQSPFDYANAMFTSAVGSRTAKPCLKNSLGEVL